MSKEKMNGMELNDEQLDSVTGGDGWSDAGMSTVLPRDRKCPICGSGEEPRWIGLELDCPNCGYTYRLKRSSSEAYTAGDMGGGFLSGAN